MSSPKYRNEYKYLISAGDLEILRRYAEAMLQKDAHVSQNGRYAGMYTIRSVYFDDVYDSAYRENENGTDPREKFRIRIYNRSDSRIALELKQKHRGKCLKQSCLLTREQCDILISGGTLPVDPLYPPILQKLLVQIRSQGLRPVVIVEYDRIPFVYPVGNVRVTLDCNVRSSSDCGSFFEEDIPMRSILPRGQHILEVKWDELLPDFIYRGMMLENLQWSSFSKFYLCRRYGNDSMKYR